MCENRGPPKWIAVSFWFPDKSGGGFEGLPAGFCRWGCASGRGPTAEFCASFARPCGPVDRRWPFWPSHFGQLKESWPQKVVKKNITSARLSNCICTSGSAGSFEGRPFHDCGLGQGARNGDGRSTENQPCTLAPNKRAWYSALRQGENSTVLVLPTHKDGKAALHFYSTAHVSLHMLRPVELKEIGSRRSWASDSITEYSAKWQQQQDLQNWRGRAAARRGLFHFSFGAAT